MLFAALSNSVCLNNASSFFLFLLLLLLLLIILFFCQGYELSGEIALKNNHYYYYYYYINKIATFSIYTYIYIIIIIIEHLLKRISLTVYQSSCRFALIDTIISMIKT